MQLPPICLTTVKWKCQGMELGLHAKPGMRLASPSPSNNSVHGMLLLLPFESCMECYGKAASISELWRNALTSSPLLPKQLAMVSFLPPAGASSKQTYVTHELQKSKLHRYDGWMDGWFLGHQNFKDEQPQVQRK